MLHTLVDQVIEQMLGDSDPLNDYIRHLVRNDRLVTKPIAIASKMVRDDRNDAAGAGSQARDRILQGMELCISAHQGR